MYHACMIHNRSYTFWKLIFVSDDTNNVNIDELAIPDDTEQQDSAVDRPSKACASVTLEVCIFN